MTTCDACGQAYTVGDWPFCPHGRYCGTNVTDTFVGGQWIENLDDKPVYVEGRQHLEREAKARGLQLFERHAPGPHGDKSKFTTRWI